MNAWRRTVGWSYLLLGVMGCDQAGQSEKDRFEQLFSGSMQVIDLTHSLANDGPFWPSPEGNPFRHEVLRAHPSTTALTWMPRFTAPTDSLPLTVFQRQTCLDPPPLSTSPLSVRRTLTIS